MSVFCENAFSVSCSNSLSGAMLIFGGKLILSAHAFSFLYSRFKFCKVYLMTTVILQNDIAVVPNFCWQNTTCSDAESKAAQWNTCTWRAHHFWTHLFATVHGSCCDTRNSSGPRHLDSTLLTVCRPPRGIQTPCLACRSHMHAACVFPADLHH